MDVRIRRLQLGEETRFVQSVRVPFLDPPTAEPEDQLADESRSRDIEVERAWVGEASGAFVANARILSLDVTVPAAAGGPCPVMRMAGVSAVGVHPTHRRRGLLRRLMSTMLEDARSRGEPVAGLIASESVIYGRFGFGLATDMAELSIDSREAAFDVAGPEMAIELVRREEAHKFLPELFDRQRRTRAGEPSRNHHDWEGMLSDRRERRGGGMGLFIALCDEGYVAYRAHDEDVLRARPVRLLVEELRGTSPAVEAALWRFVLDIDLAGTVQAKRRPVDEPLRRRLADPRQLRVTSVDDRLYLRILDVPSALEARGYRSSGRLVLDVLPPADTLDDQTDPAVGRWLLEAEGAAGCECRRARPGEDPHLAMRVTELGALYMGGVRPWELCAAGRIEELRAGGLDLADSLLTTTPAPLTGTGF